MRSIVQRVICFLVLKKNRLFQWLNINFGAAAKSRTDDSMIIIRGPIAEGNNVANHVSL